MQQGESGANRSSYRCIILASTVVSYMMASLQPTLQIAVSLPYGT